MSHVITVASPTEKSGKSSTAANLAVSFAVAENKTLLIDCDPVRGAGYGSSILNSRIGVSGFYGVMTDRSSFAGAVLPTALEFLKIIPAGADFSKADFIFGDMDGHFFKLRDMIQSIKSDFDIIIIDSPSSMHNLLKTIMMATDWVLIPLNAKVRSPGALVAPFSDMKMFLQFLISLQEQFQIFPKILGILLNQCARTEDIPDAFSEHVLEHINDYILSTRIPSSTVVSDGFALGKPAAFHNITANVTSAYMMLAEELMDTINRFQNN